MSVHGDVVSSIGRGLLVLCGVAHGDTEADAAWLADKLAKLRIFQDDDGKMNLPVSDVAGGVIVVSQFTLYADTRKGRRPSFVDAAAPEVAEPLVASVARRLREGGLVVGEGRFGASMQVDLVNDGPVTIVLESPGV